MSAIPKPYDRQTRFGAASSNNPADPVQGFDLDAEFDAVEIALDQTQARLAEIQRDDGALDNQVVTIESLHPETIEYLENLAEDAAIEAIQPDLEEIERIKNEALAAQAAAEAAEDAARVCQEQSCACAAEAEISADEAEVSADEAEAEAIEAAASADLAKFYYDQLSGTLDALAPRTLVFSGDGVTTVYNLGVPVPDEEFVDVHVNGLLLRPDQYVVNGATITFTPAPPAGTDNVVVKIASGIQIMPIVSDDWGFVYEAIGAAEDWGALA
jgi:hypothetical protein